MGGSAVKWLIIFPDSWIAYSPSVLNFITMLEKYNQEYLIVFMENGEFDNSKLHLNKVKVNIKNNIKLKILKRLKLYKIYVYVLFFFKIKKMGLNKGFDRVVGVDDLGYLIAETFYKNAIYYSLEVSRGIFNKFISFFNMPKKLIIQSEPRKNFLFRSIPNELVAYIQNSPLLQDTAVNIKSYQGNLIYFGNIIKAHGVEDCIEVLYLLTNETLTIKGTGREAYIDSLKEKYQQLIADKRLIFNTDYVSQDEIPEYLKKFDIGFCFYNMELIGIKNFNYQSSPSGKIFNYMMCSLPVIGSDVVGLLPIKENNAGILLKEVNQRSIADAVSEIKSRYKKFSCSAFQAAQKYDYEKMFVENWHYLSE